MSSHTSTHAAHRNDPRSQLSTKTDQQLTPVIIAFIRNATVPIRKGKPKESLFQTSERPENSHRIVPGTHERNSSTTNESEFHSDQFNRVIPPSSSLSSRVPEIDGPFPSSSSAPQAKFYRTRQFPARSSFPPPPPLPLVVSQRLSPSANLITQTHQHTGPARCQSNRGGRDTRGARSQL